MPPGVNPPGVAPPGVKLPGVPAPGVPAPGVIDGVMAPPATGVSSHRERLLEAPAPGVSSILSSAPRLALGVSAQPECAGVSTKKLDISFYYGHIHRLNSLGDSCISFSVSRPCKATDLLCLVVSRPSGFSYQMVWHLYDPELSVLSQESCSRWTDELESPPSALQYQGSAPIQGLHHLQSQCMVL